MVNKYNILYFQYSRPMINSRNISPSNKSRGESVPQYLIQNANNCCRNPLCIVYCKRQFPFWYHSTFLEEPQHSLNYFCTSSPRHMKRKRVSQREILMLRYFYIVCLNVCMVCHGRRVV